MIIDCFAGAGGVDEALRQLGTTDVVGIEWDPATCATRAAAGHRTICADVSAYPTAPFAGRVDGMWFSPPCPAFSVAGTGAGRDAIDLLARGMRDLLAGRDTRAEIRSQAYEAMLPGVLADEERREAKRIAKGHAERGDVAVHEDACTKARAEAAEAVLVLEPARWVRDLRPGWVACEQVPGVLVLWRVLAEGMRAMGYAAWVGILNSADYGVGQLRRRAILMAMRRAPSISPPLATHSRDPQPTLFGPGRAKWRSMAETLGWGIASAPSGLVVAANGYGGPRPLDGGTGSRDRYRRAMVDGDWVVRTGKNTMRHSRDPKDMVPFERSIDEPSPTVDGRANRWKAGPPGALPDPPMAWKLRHPGRSYTSPDYLADPLTDPSPAVAFGHNATGWRWVLNTGRDWKPGGGSVSATVPTQHPARPTGMSGVGSQWRVELDDPDEPPWAGRWKAPPDPRWPQTRPASTVARDPRIAAPGHKGDGMSGPPQMEGAIRVTVEEAAALQDFPADYPWRGTLSQQYSQVGNAVPVGLARAVCAVLLEGTGTATRRQTV